MAKLFEPFRLKDVSLRNRVAVSPMCQYSSDNGFPNEWHFVHLGSRAVGGAGLVVVLRRSGVKLSQDHAARYSKLEGDFIPSGC